MSKSRDPTCYIEAFHDKVTGSRHLVSVVFPDGDKCKFVVDYGQYREDEYLYLNKIIPFNGENIDFILLTHPHNDHIGLLPSFVKKGFYNPIYAVNDCKTIMGVSLSDSCGIIKRDAKATKQKPIYGDADVAHTLANSVCCEFNKPLQLKERIKVTFFMNGHVPGAACIFIQISYPGSEDINILFTGDYKKENVFFDVDPIPGEVFDLPITIVTESTYGTTDSDEIQYTFKKNVSKAISEGKTIVIPVIAFHRAQEVLYTLKCMQEDGSLSTDIPIYLDGKLAQRYTKLYMQGRIKIKESMKDFLPDNLTWVDKVSRPNVIYNSDAKIIVSSSGMGSFGPIQLYLYNLVPRKNVLIQFTCYVAGNTLGRRLKDAIKGDTVKICGVERAVHADIEFTSEFSSHAKADELINFLRQFKDIKLIIVNHGDVEVKEAFTRRIDREVQAKNVVIINRAYLYRIDRYGLCKRMPTKQK